MAKIDERIRELEKEIECLDIAFYAAIEKILLAQERIIGRQL